jgi:hypothetical protein
LAAFQFDRGSWSSSFRLVRPATMRSSTSVSDASGATSFNYAVWITVAAVAECLPPLPVPIHLKAAVIKMQEWSKA